MDITLATDYFSFFYPETNYFFWLQRSGREVERTTITKHSKQGFARVPDMMYHNQKNEKIYVEIELNHKSIDAYLKIIEDITTHTMRAFYMCLKKRNEKRQFLNAPNS